MLGFVIAGNCFMPQGFVLFLLLRRNKKNATQPVGSHFSTVAEEEGFEPSNRF